MWLVTKGKPPFEMCWFYMGIAQIGLDHRPSVKQANVEKVTQTILARPYTPGQRGKKVPQTILASPGTPCKPGKKMPQTILASPYTPWRTWE